ncbi:MAG: hypothetical protein FJZ60_00195 [Chlamydiae bacterium]|nr:hypothetical protein [Chlamydiota bacterium]
MSQLRRIIAEESRRILLEVGEKDEKEKEDSLDAQIDKYLLDYESDSKSMKKEGKNFRMMVRRFLLEAEDDEKKDEKDNEKKLTSEDIDVDDFTNNVMRLIENYDSLLEIQNTILRRTVNFLLKGYESDVAEAFKNNLLDRYGLEIGKTRSEIENDKYEAPTADRAGPGLGA